MSNSILEKMCANGKSIYKAAKRKAKVGAVAALAFIAAAVSSCSKGGGSDGTTPPPTPVVVTPPPTGGGDSGGNGNGYTNNPTQTINTPGGTINYNMSQQKVSGTVITNSNGGGVQTTDGGTVTTELLNVTDADMTIINLGDALEADFKANADPILEYTVTDPTAKTITKYDVHLNKVAAGSVGKLFLQGNTTTAFNDKTITYNEAYLALKAKSSTQSIQKLAVK